MRKSIREELKNHLSMCLNGDTATEQDAEQLHQIAFGYEPYVRGESNAHKWLREHGIDLLTAINMCKEYETKKYGSVRNDFTSAEIVVHVLTIAYGEDLIKELFN